MNGTDIAVTREWLRRLQLRAELVQSENRRRDARGCAPRDVAIEPGDLLQLIAMAGVVLDVHEREHA